MLIDTHAHLTDKRYKKQLKSIINNLQNDGVKFVFTVGYDKKSSKQALKLAKKHKQIYAVIGIHPSSIDNLTDKNYKWLKKNATHKKVIAIGEIGLDYFRVQDNKVAQKSGFLKQLKLADELGLPIVIHTRRASDDLVQFLQTHKNLLNNGGIVHCFSDDIDFFNKINQLGLIVSVGGAITFKNAKELVSQVEQIPLTSIVLETDSPYLTPTPFRGREINQPKYTRFVAEKLAEIKQVSLQEIINQTNENVYKLFKKLDISNNNIKVAPIKITNKLDKSITPTNKE